MSPLRLGHLRRDGTLRATPLADPSRGGGWGTVTCSTANFSLQLTVLLWQNHHPRVLPKELQLKVVSMCKSSRSSGAGPRKFTPSWSKSRSLYIGSPLNASYAEFFRFMLQFLCLQMCVYGGSAVPQGEAGGLSLGDRPPGGGGGPSSLGWGRTRGGGGTNENWWTGFGPWTLPLKLTVTLRSRARRFCLPSNLVLHLVLQSLWRPATARPL